MITFWITAALFVGVALAFVLPPLLQHAPAETSDGEQEANVEIYRDQLAELEVDLENGLIDATQYQVDRDEIERRLLSDVTIADAPIEKKPKPASVSRNFAYLIALAIPVIAIGFYFLVGTPQAISNPGVAGVPSNAAAPNPRAPFAGGPQAEGPMTQERMEANVAALAKRLEQNPDDVQGWRMLARSYSTLEKHKEASDAYARATNLKTDDADLWADYAFSLTMANGQQVQGKPLELVNKALQLDPDNPKALQLAGGAAYQAKNYQGAIEHWQRLLRTLPPDSELAQALSQKIEEARTLSSKTAK